MKNKKKKGGTLKVYLIMGVVFLALSIVLNRLAPHVAGGRLLNFMEGMGSGAFGVGIVDLIYALYWIFSGRKEEYREREENAQIEARDERSRMLRDRAGRYAYLAGLGICVLGLGVFTVLHSLEIAPWGEAVSLCLAAFLLVQVVLGAVFFYYLNKKH